VGLLRIFPNGTTTPVGPARASSYAQAQGLSALDGGGAVFYSILYDLSTGKPALVGLSLADGSIASNVPVPFVDAAFIGVGQYLAFRGTPGGGGGSVIVGGQNAAGAHELGTIDPVSGAYAQFASLNASLLDVLGGCHAAYVPATDEVLVQLGTQDPPAINLYAVNVATGAVRESVETAAANIETLNYDAAGGRVVGLGINTAGGALQRTVVALDPASLRITTLGKVSVDTIESGGISAYDGGKGVLYWIGDKTGSDAFQIIGNRAAPGAAVASTGVLCAADADCPWSMEFYPGA